MKNIKIIAIITILIGISIYTNVKANEIYDLTVPLPGSSIANPDIQLKALPEVYATVNGKSPACRSFKIIDTKVTQEPTDIKMENNEYVGGYWKEAWAVNYCGFSTSIPVKFTIEKDDTIINVQTDF